MKVLRWYKRLEIAVGVAQGLDYLHSFAVRLAFCHSFLCSILTFEHSSLSSGSCINLGFDQIACEFLNC